MFHTKIIISTAQIISIAQISGWNRWLHAGATLSTGVGLGVMHPVWLLKNLHQDNQYFSWLQRKNRYEASDCNFPIMMSTLLQMSSEKLHNTFIFYLLSLKSIDIRHKDMDIEGPPPHTHTPINCNFKIIHYFTRPQKTNFQDSI